MKLYYAPGTCALACWIALEWVGADYDVEKVNPSSQAYRNINPLGMVPALEMGRERPMTQANAILQFIAEKFPEKDLGVTGDAEARIEFAEIMSFLTGDFHPAFWPFFSPQRYTTLTSDEALGAAREASHARIDRVMSHLDSLIADGGRVYKDKRTVADPYAFVMARWSERLPKTWRDYPNVASFMKDMSDDAGVTRVLETAKG